MKDNTYRVHRERHWRLAGILNREGTANLTYSDFEALYHEQGGRCGMCDEMFPIRALQADHRHPRDAGAPAPVHGLLCRKCNRRVADMTLEDARRMSAYLMK